jgi:hypothetical protein
MQIARIFLVVGLFSWFGSGSSFDAVPKEVTIVDEEGFADFDFPLIGAAQVDDGGWLISARGLLSKKTIGFDVRLGGEWKAQDVDDGALTVFWGNGAIIRSGAESDGFCGLLQDKYQLSGSSREMPDLVETMVVSLGTDPVRITEEPLKMKMFVEPEGDESEYAEFFLNVDLHGQVVQFHEKDNEYRENLIKAFCR